MKIYIDRTHCNICEAYCDRHMAKLVRFPLGEDRPCIDGIVDDGQTELTLVVRDGPREVTLILDEDQREAIGIEGLSGHLPQE